MLNYLLAEARCWLQAAHGKRIRYKQDTGLAGWAFFCKLTLYTTQNIKSPVVT